MITKVKCSQSSVSRTMKLNQSQIAKIDPHLQQALSQAREEETIRAIAILGYESGEPIDALFQPEISPSDFTSRVAYRQALIEARQKQSSAAISSTLESLQELSLTMRGGAISETVVLEGRASEILKALDLPGLQRATLDRLIKTPDAVALKGIDKIAVFYQKILWPEREPEGKIRQLILRASEQYLLEYNKRHNRLQILGMPKPVDLESIYTAVQLLPREQIRYFESIASLEEAYRYSQWRSFEDRDCPRRSGIEVANESQFLMVLGQPGSGKTTFLRKVGLEAMKLNTGEFRHSCLPVFLELKRLKGDEPDLKKAIIDQFRSSRFPQPEEFIDRALDQGKLLLLLDGLDEVPANSQEPAIAQIQSLANEYNKNRFVASCRTAAYRKDFANFTEVVIVAFDDAQIQQFIGNWFSSQADRQAETAEKCWNLLKQPGYEAAKELAQTPLLLTFLCLVYDDSQDFPKNRAALYGEALDILLKKWAAQKRLQRDPIWQEFSPELEKEMLAELAYQTFEADRLFFPRQEAIELTQEFLANNLNAPKDLDGETLLNAIEVQQGILVERARDVYSFSHLTLQEYLTAKYIVDNRLIEELVGQHLTEERWREVFLLVAGLARGRDGDELLLLMERAARRYIIDMPKLQGLLQWANWITDGSEGDFKPVYKRALAIANLISNTSPEIYSDNIPNTITLVHAIAYNFTAEKNIAKMNPLAIAYLITKANRRAIIDSASDTAIEYANQLADLKIFNQVDWLNLVDRLKVIKGQAPSLEKPDEIILAFALLLSLTWNNALRFAPEPYSLSAVHINKIETYLLSNLLMIQCKDAAVRVSPTTWTEIEARMLRIPED